MRPPLAGELGRPGPARQPSPDADLGADSRRVGGFGSERAEQLIAFTVADSARRQGRPTIVTLIGLFSADGPNHRPDLPRKAQSQGFHWVSGDGAANQIGSSTVPSGGPTRSSPGRDERSGGGLGCTRGDRAPERVPRSTRLLDWADRPHAGCRRRNEILQRMRSLPESSAPGGARSPGLSFQDCFDAPWVDHERR